MENNIEQRTAEWHEQRKGRFTASEIVKLLGVRGLGETGKSYAIDKAIEQLYGEMEETFTSYDMQRGIELEPLAFAKFADTKELEFIDVKTCGFFEFGENAGASPDGLVGEDAILEIKCPRSTTFFELVATNEVDKKYYAQMQMQMLATNRNRAYFFNYLVHEGKEYWHEILVERDEVMCELIKNRILEATEIKSKYINKLNINKQW
jgi:exodeoxyribonuclease (lambda-induced)